MKNDCLLGERTGLRVSELVLGTARLGAATDEADTLATLHAFADAGGTFFDTSSRYQHGRAETKLGKFLEERGRDPFVVATKYTSTALASPPAAAQGNHRGSMQREVEASLRRLRTDRIDLYFPHFDDGLTPIEEVMRGLEDLARSGKIVHVGLSNFPAWRTSAAATLADLRGWAHVTTLQLQYNLLERSIEREHLPLARAHGMAVMAWSPLSGGALTGRTGTSVQNTLNEIASELGHSAAAVALAWVRAKGLFPVLGPRTASQLAGNLETLAVQLEAVQIGRLDAASAFAKGYPYDLLAEQWAAAGPTARSGEIQ